MLSTYTMPMDNIAPWLVDEWKQSWGDEAALVIAKSFMQQLAKNQTWKFSIIFTESLASYNTSIELNQPTGAPAYVIHEWNKLVTTVQEKKTLILMRA